MECDISKPQSIQNFYKSYVERYGDRLDILLNNAGIAIKGDIVPKIEGVFGEQCVVDTFTTNYFGTINMMETFLPIVKSRIINVTSGAGNINILNKEMQVKMSAVDDVQKFEEYYEEFLALVKTKEDLESHGWPKAAGYATSKLFMNLYTKLWATLPKVNESGISVISCTPGWVKTDMTGDSAKLTIDEGALTPIYLVEIDDDQAKQYHGKYVKEKEIQDILSV